MNEIVNYGITIFAFLIQGQGQKSGLQFGNAIREAYDCVNNTRNKETVEQIEHHIEKIRYDFNGKITLTYK